MILALILITVGAVATVLACKSIISGFEAKDEALDGKEKALNDELKELREKRRALKRDLEMLQKELKDGDKAAKEKSAAPKTSLKDWMIDTGQIESVQFQKAERYADEKNLDLLSALLTLNMITVDTFEKAKKMKLK